jgi:hypothetical protein
MATASATAWTPSPVSTAGTTALPVSTAAPSSLDGAPGPSLTQVPTVEPVPTGTARPALTPVPRPTAQAGPLELSVEASEPYEAFSGRYVAKKYIGRGTEWALTGGAAVASILMEYSAKDELGRPLYRASLQSHDGSVNWQAAGRGDDVFSLEWTQAFHVSGPGAMGSTWDWLVVGPAP